MGKGQPYGQYPKGKGNWDSYYPQYPQPKEEPLPTWDFNNPSAMLRDYLEELAFWKRQETVPPWKQGVKLCRSFKPGSQGRFFCPTIDVRAH